MREGKMKGGTEKKRGGEKSSSGMWKRNALSRNKEKRSQKKESKENNDQKRPNFKGYSPGKSIDERSGAGKKDSDKVKPSKTPLHLLKRRGLHTSQGKTAIAKRQ